MAPPGGGTGGGSGGGGGINPDIIRSLTELLGSSNTNLERMLENLGRLGASSQSLTGLAGAAQELSDHLGGLGRSLTDLQRLLGRVNDQSKKQSSILKMMGSAWKTFGAAVKGAMNILSGLTDVISTVGGALWDLGAAIIAAPFEMLNWLIKKSKQVIGSGTEIAEAYEKIREQFGDLTKGTSKDVIDFGKSMATGMITPTLSARRVFGSLAESLNKALEVAQAAPATFQLLSDQFEKNGLEIMAMANGLGLGNEELTALQQRAIATGTSLVDLESEITKYAKGMSAQFGLNSKAMSRDMGRALKDVKHFANSTVKEIAQATTYAHKLGLELKDITGVLDKFNTFDEAAENVSKLSQAFGINVDAMKLVEAKSPADALDMIKQAMAAAGKSADQMNRQELQLLASTVGMSEEQVRMAFSMKNSGVSMDKVKQSGTGLEHQMMSTSEAVASLADDMKRVVKAGQQPAGDSFFEIFVEGFLEGIDTSKTFLSLLQAVMKDMYIVRDAGRQLGRAFIENFPGVKDFINGLKEMLNPTAIKGLMSNVVNIFKDFFDQLNKGTADTGKLFDSLVDGFTNFAEKTSGGSQMLKGLKNIWKAVERIISTGIDWLSNKLKSGLEFIVKLLSGDFNNAIANAAEAAPGAIGDALGGAGGAIAESPISKAFISAFQKLSGPLEKIFDLLWDKIVAKLGNVLKQYKWEIALFALGPTIANLTVSAISGALSNPGVISAFSKLGPLLANPLGLAVGASVAIVAGAAYTINKDLENYQNNLRRDAALTLKAEKEKNKTFLDQNATIEQQITLLRARAAEGDKNAAAEANRLEKEQEATRQQRLSGQGKSTEDALRPAIKELGSTVNINEEKMEEFLDRAQAQVTDSIASRVKGAAGKQAETLRQMENEFYMTSGSPELSAQGQALLEKMKSDVTIRERLLKATVDELDTENLELLKDILPEYDEIDFSSSDASIIKLAGMRMNAEDAAAKEAAAESQESVSKRIKNLGESIKITPEQLRGLVDPTTGMAISLEDLEALKTTGGESAVAEALAAAAVSTDPNALKKSMADKQKEQADAIGAARREALEALDLGSDFSVKNVEESIKKVEDLTKNLDEGLLNKVTESIKKIREKFDSADFRIFTDPKKSDEITQTAIDLKMINSVFVGIADAADNMENIPKAAAKLAQLPENAKSYGTSITKIKDTLFGSEGIITKIVDIKGSAEKYVPQIESTNETIGKIKDGVDGAATSIGTIMDALPKLQRGGGLSSAFSAIDTIAKSSGNLKGEYEAGSAVKDKVASAMAAAKVAMTEAASSMPSLVTASTDLSKILTDDVNRSIDGTANRVAQLFASLEKFIATTAKPLVAQQAQELGAKVKSMVDAINELNTAMTDIKIGENGEVNVKMKNLAKGINKADHKYTIEKKNAIINLSVSVSMSVTDVESMLIKNPNSLIRLRINEALKPLDKKISDSGGSTVPADIV